MEGNGRIENDYESDFTCYHCERCGEALKISTFTYCFGCKIRKYGEIVSNDEDKKIILVGNKEVKIFDESFTSEDSDEHEKSDFRVLNARAQLYMFNAKYELAEKLLHGSLKLLVKEEDYHNHADIMIDLGVCYYEMNQLEKSIEYFALSIGKENKHHHTNLASLFRAKAFLKSGELQKALSDLKSIDCSSTINILPILFPYLKEFNNEKIVKTQQQEIVQFLENLSPSYDFKEKYRLFFGQRGCCYYKMEYFSRAFEDFRTILLKYCDNEQDESKFSSSFMSQWYYQARFRLSLQISAQPNDFRIYRKRANLYMMFRRFEDAYPDFAKIVSIVQTLDTLSSEEKAENYFLAGQCAYSVKKMSESIEWVTKAIENQPNDRYYAQRGIVRVMTRHPSEVEKGVADITIALEMMEKRDFEEGDDEKFSKLLFEKGMANVSIGKDKEALDDLKRMDEKCFGNSFLLYQTRGMLYTKFEQYEESIQDYTCSIDDLVSKKVGVLDDSFFRTFFPCYLNRGGAYLELGRHEEADVDFNMILDVLFKRCLIIHSQPHNVEGLLMSPEGESCFILMKRLTKAIEKYPKICSYLSTRGRCFWFLKDYRKSKMDYRSAFSISNDEMDLCKMAELYFDEGDMEQSQKYFKRAIDMNPENPKIYLKRYKVFKKIDLERSLDDLSRYCRMSGTKWFEEDDKNDVSDIKNMYHDIIQRLEYEKNRKEKFDSLVIHGNESASERRIRLTIYCRVSGDINGERDNFVNHSYPFTPPNENGINSSSTTKHDEDQKIECEYLRKCVSESRFIKKKGGKSTPPPFTAYRRLGKGAFGSAYLCSIEGVVGAFVVKIFTSDDSSSRSKWKKLRTKEGLLDEEGFFLPYHRNVASIISLCRKDLDITKLPDYESFWKERRVLKKKKKRKEKYGVLIMKYYRTDLEKYMMIRGNDAFPLSELEFAHILKGVLMGAYHLHKHMIVHRDLHTENIFIDAQYSRVWIGDFGCALDLGNNETGFVVHRGDERLYEMTSDVGGNVYEYMKIGGYLKYLAPEVRKFHEEEEQSGVDDEKNTFSHEYPGDHINYEKCDLFSIGILGNMILERTLQISSLRSGIEKQEKQKEEKEEEEERERYQYIKKYVGMLTKEDMDERLSFDESIEQMERILLETRRASEDKPQQQQQQEEEMDDVERFEEEEKRLVKIYSHVNDLVRYMQRNQNSVVEDMEEDMDF